MFCLRGSQFSWLKDRRHIATVGRLSTLWSRWNDSCKTRYKAMSHANSEMSCLCWRLLDATFADCQPCSDSDPDSGVFRIRIQKLKKEVKSKTILWWFNLLDLLQHYIFKSTSFDEKILHSLNNYILFSYKCIAKKYPEPNLGAFWIRIRIELFGWIRVQWIRSRNTAAKCQHQIVHLHCIICPPLPPTSVYRYSLFFLLINDS